MSQYKKGRIRLRIAYDNHGNQMLKALFDHPMHTGQFRDRKTGKIIPAEYIEDLRVSVDGETVFETVWNENISKNPYLSFSFSQALVDNQKVEVSMIDNYKREFSHAFIVKFDHEGIFRFGFTNTPSKVRSLLPKTGPACKTKIPVVTTQ